VDDAEIKSGCRHHRRGWDDRNCFAAEDAENTELKKTQTRDGKKKMGFVKWRGDCKIIPSGYDILLEVI